MNFSSIIAKRRDANIHSEAELKFLADGAASGSIPDYQLAAWLMAAYLNPLSSKETALLTLAMADSGQRIDLSGLPRPWVDKHSTGGVGDKTSIVLLPLLAACGLTVIKMSGRGLGITGGTVDKLASIPGFKLDLSPEQMKAQALKIGLAITGQSPNLAPADKALYALRDVTETVSSIPLIVSSILSKKLAGGAEIVVLDVKCGSGAFMRTRKEAELLAEALSATATLCGLKTRIVISDMDQPLGAAVGNALEVQEALDVLNPDSKFTAGTPTARFRDLCIELAGITLEASGVVQNRDAGRLNALQAIETGQAKHKATEWICLQGGPDPFGSRLNLPLAPIKLVCLAKKAGYIQTVDAEQVGQAVLELGGGRHRKDDVIDHSVGIVMNLCVGSRVSEGSPMFTVHAATARAAKTALSQVLGAITISPHPLTAADPILNVL